MRETDVREKVSIFISSNINSRYVIARESLRLLLLETGLCTVYCFEEEPASSQNVVSSYLYQIDRADLVVFLIDNSDGIGEGTLKEVKRARELKKKCLFLFCNETTKEKTELQNEIMKSPDGEKYKEVSKFSHFAEEAYLSVLADIMDNYLRYCRNNNSNPSAVEESKDVSGDTEVIQITTYKTAFSPRNFNKKLIEKFAFGSGFFAKNELLPSDDFESASGEFFSIILGEKSIEQINFEKIKETVVSVHTGRLRKIVSLRFDAIKDYWSGNPKDAITSLFQALKIARDTKSIPTWIVNDIAIDIRNISIEIDQYNNIVSFQNEGQKILDESLEPVYFPVVDRATSSYFERMFKDSVEELTEPPFAVNIGGMMNMLDGLADVFTAALLYGSITHLEKIQEKMSFGLQYIAFKTRNHTAFCSSVKMLLLLGSEDKLLKFLNAYGEYTDSISEKDVADWYDAIARIATKAKRFNSELLLLSSFGYYFSDEQFEDILSDIQAKIRIWTEEQYWGDKIAPNCLSALSNVSHRISAKACLDLAYLFHKKGLGRWYDNVYKMMRNISLKDLSENDHKKLIDWLVTLLSECDEVQSNYLLLFAQYVRMSVASSTKIDEIVKGRFPAFYKNTYSVNVIKNCNKDIAVSIDKQIADISDRNRAQGVDGKYTGYISNPYQTIENILSMEQFDMSSVMLSKLTLATIDTIHAERQTIDAKVSAISLLCIMGIYYPESQELKDAINQVLSQKENFSQGRDILLAKGYTPHVFEFAFNMLAILYSEFPVVELIKFFSLLSDCENAETIIILDLLYRQLNAERRTKSSNLPVGYMLQYLFELTRNDNKTIRTLAHRCLLTILSNNAVYEDIILSNASTAMDSDVYDVKLTILNMIHDYPHTNSKVEYIVSKGIVDNHYLVRYVAKKVSCGIM